MNPAIHAASAQLAPLAGTAEALSDSIRGIAEVIDGDTIKINGQRIRLFGIDAPEDGQECWIGADAYPCAIVSKAWLDKIVGGHPVACRPVDVDRYKRIVAICYLDDHDINAQMVRLGWAVAYRRYSTAYVGAEGSARYAKRGMWRGTFMAPWEWRKAH